MMHKIVAAGGMHIFSLNFGSLSFVHKEYRKLMYLIYILKGILTVVVLHDRGEDV
jgi:hypothetical protein